MEGLVGINKILEESSELNVILSKYLHKPDGQYYGRDLKQELIEEITDLTAALDFFLQENNLHYDYERYDRKISNYRNWFETGQLKRHNESI